MARSVARRITQFQRSEIIRLLRKGKRIYSASELDIRIYPQQQDIGRILIIIPKKAGSAPERNAVRRRLRALFYEYKLYTHGYDWAWFIKPAGIHLSYHALRHIAIDTCLPKLEDLSEQVLSSHDHY